MKTVVNNSNLQEEIKTLLWGHTSLPQIAARYEKVPFAELYRIALGVGSRYVKMADRYWLAYIGGLDLEEIAKKYNREPDAILNALEERGYEPFENSLKGNKFRLSERLVAAWETLKRPLVDLRQLMDEEIEAVKERGKVIKRTPPLDEPVCEFSIPLSEEDWDKLRFLAAHSGTQWYSGGNSSALHLKVLRTLLEDLIERTPELEEFRVLNRFSEYSPSNKLEETPQRTSFSAPLYVYRLMLPYIQARGASNQLNLSQKFRAAFKKYGSLSREERMAVLEGLSLPVSFVTPTWFSYHYAPQGKRYFFHRSVSLSLFPRHLALIQEAKNAGVGHQYFLSALYFWFEGLDQTKLKGWSDWVEFSQQDWSVGGRDSWRLNDLVENGFAGLEDCKSARAKHS